MSYDIIFKSLSYKYIRRCSYTYNNTSCCNKVILDHESYCSDHLCYKCEVNKMVIINNKGYKMCLYHYLHLLSIDEEKRLEVLYKLLKEMKYYDNLSRRYEDLMIAVKELQNNNCYNYNAYICLALMTIGMIDKAYMLKCVNEEHKAEWY